MSGKVLLIPDHFCIVSDHEKFEMTYMYVVLTDIMPVQQHIRTYMYVQYVLVIHTYVHVICPVYVHVHTYVSKFYLQVSVWEMIRTCLPGTWTTPQCCMGFPWYCLMEGQPLFLESPSSTSLRCVNIAYTYERTYICLARALQYIRMYMYKQKKERKKWFILHSEAKHCELVIISDVDFASL